MRKNLKRCPFLIFTLSILMTFCSGYLQCDHWGGIYSSPSDAVLQSVERAEGEDIFVIDPPDASKWAVSDSPFHPGPMAVAFQDFVSLLLSTTDSPQQTLSVLRC